MGQAYNNKSLFSDYYLEELVAGDPHWQALKREAWKHRQRIANILEKAAPGMNGDTPEAEVERRLIRPVLDSLEHIYFVQPAVPSPEGVRRPDYAFFPSSQSRQEAEAHKGQTEFFKTALAVGDAKAWERSLDKRVRWPGDPFTNHNPSHQIDFYLRATERKWGMLTNGRHWRLYHRDLSYRLDVYYEVDLPRIVTLDEDTFLYFLAFFHKEAFQPDGTGQCFLDRAYRASTDYATKVSEELKDNVYEALRLLAEGFLAFPGNSLKPQDLDLVRENAFIVIYRLLFILYAEVREFLPVTNPTYWGTYSLRALAHEIATKEPFEANLHPAATGYWSRLQEVFTLINSGDDFLHIPPYNGRLFDDHKEHQSLATWKIGDRYLAAAIDQLARAKAAGRTGRGFVSYRDLSIRELGSIYEGLLEHRPRYATQDVAVVKEDKRERFIPLAELGNRKALKTYRAGSVYLETDKRERKATGSYYTPDYIVKYIVGNTLGPLLEEAKRSGGNLIDTILSLKVLDPAMGSGHFLVEATDYLAQALVEALGGDPREMEGDEIRWARREVVERCIYGVDLNPLAVDLAKLSLWLSTVSLDKPLNFLDHHLRCGNSLIGARLEDLGQLPALGKKTAKALPATQSLLAYYFHQNVATAVDNYFRIAAISSDNLQDIQEKEKLYGIAREILKRYRQVAHIWTSIYFGNEVPAEGYMAVQDRIRATELEWAELKKQPWFTNGVKMGEEERRFFHWELEFPEVFFDRNGQRLPNAGFSAVVGNPPYGAQFDQLERSFFNARLEATTKDSAAYFLEASDKLSSHSYGMIVPKSICFYNEWQSIRSYILSKSFVRYVMDVGLAFPDVNYEEVVLVNSKNGKGATKTGIHLAVPLKRPKPQKDVLPDNEVSFDLMGIAGALIFRGIPEQEEKVIRKIYRVSRLFSDVFNAVFRGLYIPDEEKESLASGTYKFINKVPDVQRYFIDKIWEIDIGTRREWLSEAEKILVPRIFLKVLRGDRLVAFYDKEGGLLTTEKLVNVTLKPKGPYHYAFLLALINSPLISFYIQRVLFSKTTETSRVMDEVYVKHFPIRRINFTTPQGERERLVEEEKKLCQEYLKNKDWGKVLSFVGERLPQKQDGSADTEREQSDVVHDLLAFLAEEMTRLHKEKQAEVKGFLTWLEGYIGVSVEDLKNKTKVKDYWKAEVGWNGSIGALEQNKKAIQSAKGSDVTRREPQETIRAEFDTSVAKLRPLLERIELTDKLIDQIVYKLYGLTEDEIAVVEGLGPQLVSQAACPFG